MKRIFFVLALAACSLYANAQNENYNRLFLGYAPTDYAVGGTEIRHQGFNLGWLHGFNVAGEQLPLYLETGLTANLGFGKLFSDCDKTLNFEAPVNVTYRYNIPNTNVRLSPYFGFHFKVNAFAEDEDGDDYFDLDGSRRFQFGMQVGARIELNRFFIGAGWNKDFMPMLRANRHLGDVKTSGMRVNIGFTF